MKFATVWPSTTHQAPLQSQCETYDHNLNMVASVSDNVSFCFVYLCAGCYQCFLKTNHNNLLPPCNFICSVTSSTAFTTACDRHTTLSGCSYCKKKNRKK